MIYLLYKLFNNLISGIFIYITIWRDFYKYLYNVKIKKVKNKFYTTNIILINDIIKSILLLLNIIKLMSCYRYNLMNL